MGHTHKFKRTKHSYFVLCTPGKEMSRWRLSRLKSSLADVPPVGVPQLPIAVSGRTAVRSATAIVSGDTAAEMGRTARWNLGLLRADRPPLGTAWLLRWDHRMHRPAGSARFVGLRVWHGRVPQVFMYMLVRYHQLYIFVT